MNEEIEVNVYPDEDRFEISITDGPIILMGCVDEQTLKELHGSGNETASASVAIYRPLKKAILQYKNEDFFDFERDSDDS